MRLGTIVLRSSSNTDPVNIMKGIWKGREACSKANSSRALMLVHVLSYKTLWLGSMFDEDRNRWRTTKLQMDRPLL